MPFLPARTVPRVGKLDVTLDVRSTSRSVR
jgi:hypothetical protein